MEEQKTTLKLLTVIIPRGKGETVAQHLTDIGATSSMILYGRGTAPKYWSDMLGLGDSKSDVIISFVRSTDVQDILDDINKNFHLSEAGKGVAFTINVNGLSSKNFFRYCVEQGGQK